MQVLNEYSKQNLHWEGLAIFSKQDPQLSNLAKLAYKDAADWWQALSWREPGIYILTGGRQVGKSTSTKLLIQDWLKAKHFQPHQIFYLPCDEIFDAKQFSVVVRTFLDAVPNEPFLLIVDEVTFVRDWDRVIKALADEGQFQRGICLLTGSDSLILKEASMRFPGRRGRAEQVDFHLQPLSFRQYVDLVAGKKNHSNSSLAELFNQFLKSGGYLRAINDVALYGEISSSTYLTYEQWIRGDFLRKNKSEMNLLLLLKALCNNGVSQISYSKLTQNIGLMSKDTCIEYCNLLERMDILFNLQAYDQNKQQGFPKKDRKFHFFDPFIQHTIVRWLQREGYLNGNILESNLVEACVASHCYRRGRAFYFKGQGEIDVIMKTHQALSAVEVKWSETIRPQDLKMLHQFDDSTVLHKSAAEGQIEEIKAIPVYRFLYELKSLQSS